MDANTFIQAVFLCLLNVSFMVVGIFLNAVVIISLRRWSQLRNKLGYFMIFVLSCFDLAVVAVIHPSLILATILWTVQNDEGRIARTHVSVLLTGFSLISLLTLNFERFLALTYPFFHQTAVTKRRLVLFQAFWMIVIVSLSPTLYMDRKIYLNIVVAVFFSFLLFAFIFLNYKMFILAKSKRNDARVAPAAMSPHQQRKKNRLNLKNVSTCSLAVGCFLICSFPKIIYSSLRSTSDTPRQERNIWLFGLWSNSLVAMNSTFNCLIFFWRNSILRREGIKILKRFQSARS